MKPRKCRFCEGNLQKGKTEFVARAYYSPEISRKIDEVMREFHRGKLLVRPLAAGEVELKLEA